MKATTTRTIKLTALSMLGALALVGAETDARADIRDHRNGANVRDHRSQNHHKSPPPRQNRTRRPVITPPRRDRASARDSRSRQPRGSYYVRNGLFVYDTPPNQVIRDPLWFRYPGVADPMGPVLTGRDENGDAMMWIPGYWDWSGRDWVWIDGRWTAPRPGYVWQPTRWLRVEGRWIKRPGRWVRRYR